jgi:hypothetical protein
MLMAALVSRFQACRDVRDPTSGRLATSSTRATPNEAMHHTSLDRWVLLNHLGWDAGLLGQLGLRESAGRPGLTQRLADRQRHLRNGLRLGGVGQATCGLVAGSAFLGLGLLDGGTRRSVPSDRLPVLLRHFSGVGLGENKFLGPAFTRWAAVRRRFFFFAECREQKNTRAMQTRFQRRHRC